MHGIDRTLTAMAFLGQSYLYDDICWNSHLSMIFLGFGSLLMSFLRLSLKKYISIGYMYTFNEVTKVVIAHMIHFTKDIIDRLHILHTHTHTYI